MDGKIRGLKGQCPIDPNRKPLVRDLTQQNAIAGERP